MNNDNSTPQPARNRAIAFAIGMAIAVGFGTAGSGDYDQALADQALRTSMQQQGLWPKGEEQELPMEALTSTDVLVAR